MVLAELSQLKNGGWAECEVVDYSWWPHDLHFLSMPHMAGSVQNQKGLLRKHNTSTNISLSHRDQNIPRLGTRAAPPEFTDVGGPLPHTTPLNMATVKAYILKNIHRRVAPTYHNNLKRSKLQREANTGEWKIRETPNESCNPCTHTVKRDEDDALHCTYVYTDTPNYYKAFTYN